MAQSLVDTIETFLTPCKYAWAILLDGGRRWSEKISRATIGQHGQDSWKSNSSLDTWEFKRTCLVCSLCPISHGTHKNSAFLTSQPQLRTRGMPADSRPYIGNWAH